MDYRVYNKAIAVAIAGGASTLFANLWPTVVTAQVGSGIQALVTLVLIIVWAKNADPK